MEFVNTKCRLRHLVSVILREQALRSIPDDSKRSEKKKVRKELAISLCSSRGDFTNGYCKQMLLATKLFFSSIAGKKIFLHVTYLISVSNNINVYMYEKELSDLPSR